MFIDIRHNQVKNCLKDLDSSKSIIFLSCSDYYKEWLDYLDGNHISNRFLLSTIENTFLHSFPDCEGINNIIAVGGGKVIDYVKRCRSCTNIENFIVIPTLFGNGSHITNISVVDDPGGRFSIQNNDFIPNIVYLDTYFMQFISQEQLKLQWCDAWAHAIESMINPNISTEAYFLCSAGKQYLDDFINLYKNNYNMYKTCFLQACTYVGLGMGMSGTGLAHLLSYPFTNEGIPHAEAIKNILPWTLDNEIDDKLYLQTIINYDRLGINSVKMPLEMGIDKAIEQCMSDLTHIRNCSVSITEELLRELFEEIVSK